MIECEAPLEGIFDIHEPAENVYFLGSGVSSIFGMPVFGNIRCQAIQILKNLKDDDYRKLLFCRVLKNWESQFDEYNIEQYYSAVESLEQVQTNIFVHTIDIMNVFYDTIIESFESSKENYIRNSFRYFDHLFKKNDRIITTNWDINIESFIPDSKGNFKSYLKNSEIDYCGITSYDKNIEVVTDKKIIKLNGSLNWGYCTECKKIFYFNEDIYKNFILTLRPNYIHKCKHCGKGFIFPVIIPPTLSKFIKMTNIHKYINTDLKKSLDEEFNDVCFNQFTKIWRRAFDYILTCKKLYFIGYSFPITDMAIRNLVNVALKGRNDLEIIVITNKKCGISRVEFENNYMTVIPRQLYNNLRFYYYGFENYDFQNDKYKTISNKNHFAYVIGGFIGGLIIGHALRRIRK